MDVFVKTGDKHFKKGQKELKTSVIRFKFKPDHNSAVMFFEDAAKSYKNGEAWEKAIKSYEQAIMCNEQLDDAWGVARGLEGIIEIYLGQPQLIKDEQRLIEQAKKAAQYFKAEDSSNNIMKLYQKLAQLFVKQGKLDLALSLARDAYEEAIDSEKNYNVSDIMNYYVDLLVQNKHFSMAIGVYKQQIDLLKNKNTKVPLEIYCLMIICLCLIENEPIRAKNELSELAMEVECFMKCGEYNTCSRMLDFYENGEQEEFTKLVKRPPVSLQYPVIIPRLMQKVKVKQIMVADQTSQPQFQQQQQQQLFQQPQQEQQSQVPQQQQEQQSEEQAQKQLEDMVF